MTEDSKGIRFKAKPWQKGRSFVVTLPKQFITQGLIDVESEYQFYMTKLSEVSKE